MTAQTHSRVPKQTALTAKPLSSGELRNKLIEHKQYIAQYGDDMPEVREWKALT